MRKILIAGLIAASSLSAAAQAVLFPNPIHVTREVSDSLSRASATVEEYLVGDRVISIRDERTSIADYSAGTLTEIDRGAGTYSVTPFVDVARARSSRALGSSRRVRPESIAIQEAGAASLAGHAARRFRAIVPFGADEAIVEVSISDSLRLSKDAIEVVTGTAWPGTADPQSEVAIQAARLVVPDSQARAQLSYGFPLEQVSTVTAMGEEIRSVNRVLRLGSELPPADLVAIPPGAREVPSALVERERLLEELDRLPSEGVRP